MSAGEIDSLEIKISAESAEAAKHIIDLANSLDALSFSASTSVGHLKDLSKTLQGLKFPSGIKAFSNNAELLTQSLNSLSGVDTSSIQGIARNTESLSRISENLKELKVGDRTQESIAQLRRAIVGLDSVSTNVNIDAAADNIQTAVNKLNDVDVSGAVSSLTRLTPQLEAVTNALTGIESASYNFGELSNQIQTLSQSISVIGMSDIGNADDIVDFLTNLQSVHIDSDFAKNLNSIGKAMNNMSKAEPNENAADSLRLFIDTVRIITDDDIARLNAIADAAQNLSVTNIEMPDGSNVSPIPNDVLDSMRNFFSVTEQAAAATNGAEQSASRFSIRLNDVARSAAAVAGTMTRAVLAPVTRITDGFKNATKKAGEFLSGIKRIAMYRAIRSAIKSISEGFKEGRENLYQYSLLAGTKFAESMDKAATASLYLKNSIGAATAPITNYLVPIIDKAVDHIVELINKFNELTATLLKQDTWTKALKYPTKWADAADDATKSAKKLKNAMLGFDELNVIEPPSVGNMKSLADELDYSKMFVEVQTKLDLSEKFKDLTMPIKLAWDKEGDNTIKTIKDTWNEVLSLVHAVGESFRTVWTNGTGQRSLELILQIVQNIVGTFGELARGIREAWQENETGTRIIQSVWNAANNLLTIFRDIWGAIKEWAAGLDWSPLMDAVAGLSESFERLTDPTGALAKIAKGAFDKLLLPLGTWLIEKGLPSAVDLLTSSFDALNVALDFLEPSLQKVYDGLKWIGELTFDNITGLTDVYSSFIDILSGKEVSDEKENRMRDIQDKAIDKLGGKGSTFDTIEKKIEDWGSHGLYDWVEWKKSGITAIGEIGKTIGEQFKKEYEDAMSVSNTDIIPEQNIAAFNKDVKTITDGYSKIGTSASAAYKITGSKSSVGQSGGSDTPKSGIKGFQNDWASGMISMSYGWNNFTNGIKENWRTFKSDWANGIASMETGWSNFTNGVKMKWQTFKDDWASGMTGLSQSVSNEWVKIKTFFTDGWDAIKNGVSQFGEDWSNGWATVKDSVSDMWENAKSDFESGWDTISEGIESFKKAFGSGMDSIKKTAKNTWSNISSTLSSKWDDFKKFVKDYGKNWTDGFDVIKTTVSDTWDSVKDRIGDSGVWSSLTQNVSEYAGNWFDKFNQIRNKVKETFDRIYDLIINSEVGKAVTEIADNIKESISGIWGDETSGIKGTFVKISHGLEDFIHELFNNEHLGSIGDKLKDTLNHVIDAFETAINYIIKGLNFFIDSANDALDIHIDIPSWVPGIGGSKFEGFTLPEIPEFTFYKFANGGFPDEGSLFLANEPGNPEMVGKIGNHTAVANNDQIVRAVSKGVYDAVVSAMSQSNRTESGKTELHVYLDRQEITAQVEQQQRENGVGIMSGLIYT